MEKYSNMSNTQERIAKVCDDIKQLLLEKNRKYGDSALNPIRIFSTADSTEQLKVRIDDKLNRLKNLQDDESEDTITDLIGYLILLKINTTKQEEISLFALMSEPSKPFSHPSAVKPITSATDISNWGGKL
jgi:hypothetical protein